MTGPPSEIETPPIRTFLWSGCPRRAPVNSSPGHEIILTAAKHYLKAVLVTGHQSDGCSPWADGQNKARLSKLIERIWRSLSKRLGKRSGQRDADVQTRPEPAEARKVNP